MASSNNGSVDFKFFRYDPSLAAAIIFLVAFMVTSTFHLYQMISTRTWHLVPLVLGGFFEAAGYVGRAVCAEQTPNWTLGPYIIEMLFPLVASALLAASIYVILGRIILLVDGESMVDNQEDVVDKSIRVRRRAVLSTAICSAVTTGAHIVVAGVLVQIVFFGFFMIVAFIFDHRIRYHPTPKSQSGTIPWQKHMFTLYATSVLVMARSVFRVIEYIQGNDGYLMRHEWFLYIFDALLMFTVLVNFNFVHPSQINALFRGGKWPSGIKMLSIDSTRSLNGSESPFGNDQHAYRVANGHV